MHPAPTVVKLGGSHAFSEHLAGWIEAIARCAGDVIVVPGGGPFADAVRDAQPKIGFDEAAAHHMALLAMEQYGRALSSLNASFVLAHSLDKIVRVMEAGLVPVWAPTSMVLAAKEIAASWDITSDSLAAWLAGHVQAKLLVLVKHVSLTAAAAPVHDLIARGIVDAAFADFHRSAGVPARVLGPADQSRLLQIVRQNGPDGTRIDR